MQLCQDHNSKVFLTRVLFGVAVVGTSKNTGRHVGVCMCIGRFADLHTSDMEVNTVSPAWQAHEAPWTGSTAVTDLQRGGSDGPPTGSGSSQACHGFHYLSARYACTRTGCRPELLLVPTGRCSPRVMHCIPHQKHSWMAQSWTRRACSGTTSLWDHIHRRPEKAILPDHRPVCSPSREAAAEGGTRVLPGAFVAATHASAGCLWMASRL